MKWNGTKQLLGQFMHSGDIRVHSEDARTLEMDQKMRATLESKFGMLLSELDPTLQDIVQAPTESVGAPPAKAPESLGLWHLDAIGLSESRRNGLVGTGTGVTVAVLDTGIDGSHSEFRGKRIPARHFDQDGIGKAIRRSKDTIGHGTFIAGLICGATVGIAPAAQIVSGVVLPQGTGTDASILAGMNWVAELKDVQIVVMSFGVSAVATHSPIYQEAIFTLLELGILPIIAAGNNGRGHLSSPGNTLGGLVVGWTNCKLKVAPMSGSGRVRTNGHTHHLPDLVAPGEDVYSALPGNSYARWNGATPATAIVAGVAALVREKYPYITVWELCKRILAACKKLDGLVGRQGAGLVQVKAAL
jgi:subtilisin family serine protease